MDRPTPTQLLRLGLTELQAAVLAAVAAEGDTTTPAVVGRTGAGRAAVSTALAVLEEREAEHERSTREAREAVGALVGALARRAARPRPDVRRRALGVDVRVAAEQLPAVTVADGVRGRVEVAAAGRGGRGGWTEDPPQVRALQRLFALWWSEAA